MIINENIMKYPDGTKLVIELLNIFPVLKIKQVCMYLMQVDKAFNEERALYIIDELVKRGVLISNGNEISYMEEKKKNTEAVAGFWVLLHYLEDDTKFDAGRYPSEIIFKTGLTNREIIVCDKDFLEKLDYLSKRKRYYEDTEYLVLILSSSIEELDDSLLPDAPLVIITMGKGVSDTPKLIYHEVITKKK